MQKDVDVNAEEDRSTYSGTFRWKTSKKLPSLPPLQESVLNSLSFNLPNSLFSLNEGWKSYFLSRGNISLSLSESNNKKLIETALEDLSLVDCLSFSLSIAFLILEKDVLQLPFLSMKSTMKTLIYEELNILCVGCASKTEERILKETNAFQELKYLLLPFFRKINFWLIGPEISSTQENVNVAHLTTSVPSQV
jgi:hypothetical protein